MKTPIPPEPASDLDDCYRSIHRPSTGTQESDTPNPIAHIIQEPPYYAVIIASTLTDPTVGYKKTVQRMLELATQQPGSLGVESARNDALDITVSYRKDLASIWEWRNHTEHKLAQQRGQNQWYHRYTFRIAKVDRVTEFDIDSAT